MVKDRPKPVEKTVEKYFALVFQIQQALEPSSGLMSSSVPLLPSIKSLQLKHQRAHKALKKREGVGLFSFSHPSFQSLHDLFKDFLFNKSGIALQSPEWAFQRQSKIAKP